MLLTASDNMTDYEHPANVESRKRRISSAMNGGKPVNPRRSYGVMGELSSPLSSYRGLRIVRASFRSVQYVAVSMDKVQGLA